MQVVLFFVAWISNLVVYPLAGHQVGYLYFGKLLTEILIPCLDISASSRTRRSFQHEDSQPQRCYFNGDIQLPVRLLDGLLHYHSPKSRFPSRKDNWLENR